MATFSNCYFEFTIKCPPGYITPQQAVERLIAIGWIEPRVIYSDQGWICYNGGAYGQLTVYSRTFHFSTRGYFGLNDGFLRLVDEYSLESEIKHHNDRLVAQPNLDAYHQDCDSKFRYPSGKDSGQV